VRVFVAVTPPPEVQRTALDVAGDATRDLGDGIRWAKPENVHLTLKFLGEIHDEALESICGALKQACSAHAPFDARLRGVGAFPSPRRARIIWAGMDEGSEKVSALAASVESALEPVGFRREGRRYVPHATLGRARGRSVGIDLPEKGILETPVFRVVSAELTKSTLTPRGSIYETVETFALNRAEGSYSR
jgi:2'-5' RNA ligase